MYRSGLPDGLFSNQKSQFWENFQGLRLKNIDIPIIWPFETFYGYTRYFYEHLVNFVFIWYIFSSFGIMHQEKSGNPDIGREKSFQRKL
jgi:hypothetical protein